MTQLLPLSPEFFAQNTLWVAKRLLGKHLMVWDADAHDHIVCRIVETEAYTQNDPACHAHKSTTGRAATLYKEPGLAYVYFIYGMYYCLNVVTEPTGTAGAVLFRALEPVYNPTPRELKTHGPGRLCKALNITKDRHNERLLTDPSQPLYLADGITYPDAQIITTTRIGISQAQEYPWRFYVDQNPWVSVKAKKAPHK